MYAKPFNCEAIDFESTASEQLTETRPTLCTPHWFNVCFIIMFYTENLLSHKTNFHIDMTLFVAKECSERWLQSNCVHRNGLHKVSLKCARNDSKQYSWNSEITVCFFWNTFDRQWLNWLSYYDVMQCPASSQPTH